MRPIDRQALIDVIADAKRTDPETGSFVGWLADCLVEYLKQPNEWVSVEERLPDKPCRVLVRVTGLDILDIDTDRLVNGRWIRWPGYVTHWMLLPAPPDRRPPEGEEDT